MPFCPPLPEIGCPKFKKIRNPWRKLMERCGLRCENFCSKMVLNCRSELCSLLIFFCSLHLNVFFNPLPKAQCPNYLDFPNPWGKLMERSGIRFEHFAHKRCKIAAIFFFLTNFALLAGFFWYWCYYPHRSRGALSPVCRIFSLSIL